MTQNDDDDPFDPRWEGNSIPKKHWHFHKQLHARYGIVMEPGEFGQMLRDVKEGRARLIERRSPTMAIYSVLLRRTSDRFFVVMANGHVVTALPPDKKPKPVRRELPG